MSYQGNYPPSTPLTSSQIAAGAVQPTNLSTQGPYWDGSGNVGIGTSSPTVYGTYKTLEVRGTGGGLLQIGTGATTAAYIYQDGTNSGFTNISNGILAFGTNNTERMRIDSSGNVGIGTSSPATKLQVTNSTASDTEVRITNGQDANNVSIGKQGSSAFGQTAAGNGFLYTASDWSMMSNGGAIKFATGGSTERARIDASGRVKINTTGAYDNDRLTVAYTYGADGGGIDLVADNTSAFTAIHFRNPNGIVGSVYTNGSATTYGTTSDYRLKNSVAPLNSGIATVAALKPVTYKWNADNSDGEGFIAHELQEVIPHAVTGEKDAVNDDGSIKPQGVDYSKIVVHIVAAIQELSAKNDALEARLAALEAK
jgi:hypothetical protein